MKRKKRGVIDGGGGKKDGQPSGLIFKTVMISTTRSRVCIFDHNLRSSRRDVDSTPKSAWSWRRATIRNHRCGDKIGEKAWTD